jgi:hypothetical protein
MPRETAQRAPDHPAEYHRFLDMAKEIGADEAPNALDKVFDQLKPTIVRPRPMKEIPIRRRAGKPDKS